MVCAADADLPASDAFEAPNLFEHVPYNLIRCGKSQAFVPSRLRQDQRVDADDVAIHVDQRARRYCPD